MKIYDKKGNIKTWASDLIALIGVGLVLSILWFKPTPILSIIGFCLGLFLVGFAGLALKSKTLDLRAFTNDPLGWRKIKKSEGASAEQEKSEKSGDNRIDPS